MRVIVCGGREFDSPAKVFRALDEFHAEHKITALMQGGANGADSFGRDWAKANGVQCWVCRADWQKHGKAAGPIRNARMLEWGPDVVIAFPGGPGTADMTRRAREANVLVHEPLKNT